MVPPSIHAEADITAALIAKLREKGLVLAELIADGKLQRCGTTAKPNGKDGAYTAHLDHPANIWWQNHMTGATGRWCAVADAELTRADRERLSEQKAAREAEQAADHDKAAQGAQAEWDSAKEEDGSHDYLQRKSVDSFELRRASDGKLLVPLRGASGKLWTMQRIGLDGTKGLFPGGKKAGHFFTIPAKDGNDTGPLLIAEGYATAASLHMATGYESVMAVDTGNLKPVAKALRAKYPNREIVVCADNDCTNREGEARDDNPGRKYAEAAASSIGGIVALCPAHEGQSTDFNDLHAKRGLEAVRESVRCAVEKAREAHVCPMPEGFRMIAEGPRAGLYCITTTDDGDVQEKRLGPPLHVLGMTRDAEGGSWGLMLQWLDPDGKQHRWAMPKELLFRRVDEWVSGLVHNGWTPAHRQEGKIAEFLKSVTPNSRYRCVNHTGWSNDSFVLPTVTIGNKANEKIVLQSDMCEGLPYTEGGSREGWNVAAELAASNSRYEFALCAALAGPLLKLVGMEGGGFHLVGASSCGKTTALKLAASVWGEPVGHIRTWRSTSNALEGLAVNSTDTLLLLDEMTQAEPSTVETAAYMLADGKGKSRANRDGSTRANATWRVLFLSSGEKTLEATIAEAGRKPKAGMEVRLVDIPADSGAGHGVPEELHNYSDGQSFVDAIDTATQGNYGHAGRAWLHHITEDIANIRGQLRSSVAEVASCLCPSGANGQVMRVARRFALCAVAGAIAKEAGILPPAMNPTQSVKRCFDSWLEERGTDGASEDAAILTTIRQFIGQHGASRFQRMDGETCHNRVGFIGETEEYIFLPETFKSEVLKGYDLKRAVRVLKETGWLKTEPSRNTQRHSLPGYSRRTACYVIRLPEEPADIREAGTAKPVGVYQ